MTLLGVSFARRADFTTALFRLHIFPRNKGVGPVKLNDEASKARTYGMFLIKMDTSRRGIPPTQRGFPARLGEFVGGKQPTKLWHA